MIEEAVEELIAALAEAEEAANQGFLAKKFAMTHLVWAARRVVDELKAEGLVDDD